MTSPCIIQDISVYFNNKTVFLPLRKVVKTDCVLFGRYRELYMSRTHDNYQHSQP